MIGLVLNKVVVYSQTPTFNATPVVAACLAAVRRGIEVTLYLDIGFNDAVSCICISFRCLSNIMNVVS